MRKQQIEHAAYEVATQIRAVEDVIDNALGEIAELQRAWCGSAPPPASASPSVMALRAAGRGPAGPGRAARGGMANCHAELVEAKAFVPGLRTVSFGEGSECPPQEGAGRLRVVA